MKRPAALLFAPSCIVAPGGAALRGTLKDLYEKPPKLSWRT
eukprot:COSAG03_NODE_20550_length_317_cov_0.949541_1_plen_40_part_01